MTLSVLLLLLAASSCVQLVLIFFFFNDTATTEIYTLSLHDALPICLHHDPAIGLLLVRGLDHVDLALQPEQLARQRQRRAPLARARLRGEARDFLALVVISLSHSGVWFVAAGRTDTLVFVVDARGRAEHFLEPARANERRRPPELEDITHLVGDLDPALAADLLLDELHREQRGEILRPDGLAGPRVQHGWRGRLEVGLDVVPLRRDVLL